MNNIWILTGESSRATIYTMATHTADLEEVQCFSNTAARQHEQDLTSDLPGKGFDGKGGGQHGLTSKGSKKDSETLNFAKTLCDTLEDGRLQGQYKELVLCASPHFLGVIRQNITVSTRHCVVAEIDKNLVKASTEEIRRQVHDKLFS
ncbi:MAG: host attachment protein [Porticoccaceae bacterium]|nr:host attachment protein [Porticoccaceae bacterium]